MKRVEDLGRCHCLQKHRVLRLLFTECERARRFSAPRSLPCACASWRLVIAHRTVFDPSFVNSLFSRSSLLRVFASQLSLGSVRGNIDSSRGATILCKFPNRWSVAFLGSSCANCGFETEIRFRVIRRTMQSCCFALTDDGNHFWVVKFLQFSSRVSRSTKCGASNCGLGVGFRAVVSYLTKLQSE